MKKAVFSILLTSWAIISFSQDYFPLLQENNSWNILSIGLIPENPYPPDTIFSQINLKIMGDTIINSTFYNKLYKEMSTDIWEPNSYLRENDKKIWFRNLNNEEEYLLYDFSVEEGDTIVVGMDNAGLSVDSITWVMVDQTLRKKYWLSNSLFQYSENWIEGVGCNMGLLSTGSYTIVGGYYELLCMSENDALIYHNPDYESCDFVNKIEENSFSDFKVFPIPASEFLYFENSKNRKLLDVSLVNIMGQITQHYDINTYLFDVSNITKGIYFLKIKYTEGEWVKKVIIE